MPLLADIFSAGNTIKRRMKDFVADPRAFLETELAYRNQKAGEFNTLQDLALQGDINRLQGIEPTQDQQAAELKLRDIVAGAYNPAGITVYHGSPYLFAKLNPAKIGTGEGAQAYGAGAGYTAEARGVAEKYSPRDYDYEEHLLKLYNQAEKKRDYSSMEVLESAMMHKRPAELRNMYGQKAEQVIKNIENVQPKSYLYKGDIPDEVIAKFLDYDTPLKDQSPEVQALAKSLRMDLEDLGGDLLAKVGKNFKGTQTMYDSGIRGVRYLDQGSRGEGKGTSNFVPFSPEDFKIQEINDEPLESWLKSGRLKVDENDPLMQFLGYK